ncbi:MAG: DUF4421 family protein [Bacteroidales bacterium]|nr:DUF4421 family protein [Bacteroidales bacterium]
MSVRKTLLVISLVAACFQASAQDLGIIDRIVKSFFDKVSGPDPRFDSSYVTRPALPWSFSVGTTLISTGSDLKSDIKVTDYTSPNAPTINADLESRMRRHLHKKVGGSIGYGSLSLSGAIEVGSKNPGKNTFFSFSFRQPSYGAKIHYYRTHEYVDGILDVEGASLPYSFTSDYPGMMSTLTFDAYYLFNHRRFSYTAATEGNFVQHRSAGSWMAIAKYHQGDMSLDQADKFMLSFSNGLCRYTTRQISLGAGYSFNYVPIHRDVSNHVSGKGFRNLTINLSAIPMASLYNHLYTYSILRGDDSSGKSSFDGRIVPAFIVRGGISFSWDRFSLVSSTSYNSFGFNGLPSIIWEDGHRLKNDIETNGMFYDLTTSFSLIVRL